MGALIEPAPIFRAIEWSGRLFFIWARVPEDPWSATGPMYFDGPDMFEGPSGYRAYEGEVQTRSTSLRGALALAFLGFTLKASSPEQHDMQGPHLR